MPPAADLREQHTINCTTLYYGDTCIFRKWVVCYFQAHKRAETTRIHPKGRTIPENKEERT